MSKSIDLNSFTPGPWEYDRVSCRIIAHDAKGLFHIADVRGWGHLTGKGHGAWGLSDMDAMGIQIKNARLISCAPDLVEALKQTVNRLEQLRAFKNGERKLLPMVDSALEYAYEVLAKAVDHQSDSASSAVDSAADGPEPAAPSDIGRIR